MNSSKLSLAFCFVTLAGCASHGVRTAVPSSALMMAAIAVSEDRRALADPIWDLARSSPDVAVRGRAVVGLGRLQVSGAMESLAAVVRDDPAESVVRAALFAIGQLGLAEGVEIPDLAVTLVRESLDSSDRGRAALAVEALGKLAPPEASALLVRLLADLDERVRAEAATALFRLRFVPLWRKAVKEPPALDDDAIAGLARALSDPSPEVRVAAAHALSRFGDVRANRGLVEALADPDSLVRLFAVRALGRGKDSGVLTAVLTRLRDDVDPAIRTEAVLALIAIGGADSVPTAVLTGSATHRIALARAFTAAATEVSVDALKSLITSKSPAVAAVAIEGLAKRLASDPRIRGQLSLYLASESWQVRAGAARGTRYLGEGALPLVEVALADADMRVRSAALEALAELGAFAVDALIDRALDTPDLAVRGAAIDLLTKRERPDRVSRLTSIYEASPGVEWIEIRESIAESLGELEGSEAQLGSIAKSDPEAAVRMKARVALAKRGIASPGVAAPTREASPFLGRVLPARPVVVLETNRGRLRIALDVVGAPIHVAAFLARVEAGLYDGLIWHRVVPNFVIQGGDPRGDGWGGPGYTLRDEIGQARFTRGTVGMPKAGKDTGGCQIFISHLPTPHLDGNYTIFGQVIEGLDVIDQIEIGDRIERAFIQGSEV